MTNTNYPSATPETQPPPRRGGSKTIIIVILAAGLLGTWGYLLYDKNKSSEKIQTVQTQNTSYMSQRDSLKMLYDEAESRLDSITGANNNIQGQLTDRQKDIASLRSEIKSILNKKNASDAELSRARTLIATLNDKIAGLEEEVTRLVGENQQLTYTNTQLSEEKAGLEQNLVISQSANEELAKTVDVASTFSASNIQVTAMNEKKSGKEKETTTAKKVDKLVVSFDVTNRIAQSGPADLYIMVTAPDGKVITDPALGSSTLTTRVDGDKTFTTKLPIQYDQGAAKHVQFPIHRSDFATGDYKIEVYHNGFKIGEGTRTLKKGGLFG